MCNPNKTKNFCMFRLSAVVTAQNQIVSGQIQMPLPVTAMVHLKLSSTQKNEIK